MGRTKDLYADLMARVEIPETLYKQLKEEHEEIVFRSWTSENLKKEYAKNTEWKEATKTIKEAIDYRNEIESEIRVEKQFPDL